MEGKRNGIKRDGKKKKKKQVSTLLFNDKLFTDQGTYFRYVCTCNNGAPAFTKLTQPLSNSVTIPISNGVF